MPRRGSPTPAGPRRGESVREWYFALDGPARYRVVIEDGAVRGSVTVWAMSPGEALDAVIIDADAREHVNVRGAPAHVEETAREPRASDLKATDEGWPYAPPPRLPRFQRQDITDALLFVVLFAVAGAVLGLYAVALIAVIEEEWLRGAVATAIAAALTAALATVWLKA